MIDHPPPAPVVTHAKDMTDAEFAALKRELLVDGPVRQTAEDGMTRFWRKAKLNYPDLELPKSAT